MNIDNIEIKIKKWDKTNEKNQVIVNLNILECLEIRGYIVRYITTKNSPIYPVWIVSPPSKKVKNKFWFHIVRFTDSRLWEKVEKKIVELVKNEYSS